MENIFVYNNSNLLPLYVMRTGFKEQQYHIIRGQGYPAYQLAVCTHGTGEFICMGIRHTIERGDVFIFEPRVPHEYYPVNTEWSIHFFIFGGDGISGIMKYMNIESYAVFSMDDDELAKYTDTVFKLHESYKTKPEFTISSLMYQLLSQTYNLKRKKPAEDEAGEEIHERIITPVVRYMRKKYRENINLDDMCMVAEVSRSYLCRVFKRKTGITPIRFLLNIRIEEAKKRLISTDMRVSGIAAEVGFNDVSYFCAVFKNCVGITPEEYRKVQTD